MAARLLLGRVEDTEVPADDLGGGVPLDASGAGVPAHHVPVGIEHEDRVVAHGGHQQAEPLLAAAQLVLRMSLGADVLDLREDVERLALRVTHRGERDPHGPGRVADGQGVLEADQVAAELDDRGEPVVEMVAVAAHQHAVVDPDEVGGLAAHQLGQGGVGADDATVEGQRRHADRGLFEDLAEPLEMLVEDLLVRRSAVVRLGIVPDHPQPRRGCRRRAAHRLPEPLGQLADRERLLDEVGRALGPGPVGQATLLEAGVDDHPGVGRQGEDRGQRLQPVHRGHGGVQQHHRRL